MATDLKIWLPQIVNVAPGDTKTILNKNYKVIKVKETRIRTEAEPSPDYEIELHLEII